MNYDLMLEIANEAHNYIIRKENYPYVVQALNGLEIYPGNIKVDEYCGVEYTITKSVKINEKATQLKIWLRTASEEPYEFVISIQMPSGELYIADGDINGYIAYYYDIIANCSIKNLYEENKTKLENYSLFPGFVDLALKYGVRSDIRETNAKEYDGLLDAINKNMKKQKTKKKQNNNK